MNIFLTGATGFVGSAVLQALRAHDHDVTALVRSESSARAVTAAGATAVQGDITDSAYVQGLIAASDAAIHTASPGDASSADVDRAVAVAAAGAFTGTNKTYIHTSGIWIYGTGSDLAEDDAFDAPALTAWRAEVEKIVMDAERMRTVILAPAVVYGQGKGLPNLISQAPTDADGALRLIGDGQQHWTTVHVHDLANLYLLAVENSRAEGYLIGASGDNPTVRELGEAANVDHRVHPETSDETRARLGEMLTDALLLDQQTVAAKAHSLGWQPTGPTLVEELATGSYRG